MAGTAAGPAMTDVLNRTADSALLGDRTALGTTTAPLEVRAPVDLGMPGQRCRGRRTAPSARTSAG
jgi:hypothetical protein